MTRRWKTTAFPFTSAATVDANVLTIESVDATDAIAAAALAGLGDGSTLTEAGGTGDQLTAIPGISGSSGTGSNTIQFEITNSSGTLLENATVTLRLNDILKATGSTDETGRLSGTGLAVAATGTYELSVTCDGYNGHTASLVVTAGVNTMVEVELTGLTVTPPTNPTDCACAWVCLDSTDTPTAGVIVRARPDTDASGDGYAWSGRTRESTSVAGTGLATINLPQGSIWWIRAGSGEEVKYTVPATATDLAGSIRGGKRDAY